MEINPILNQNSHNNNNKNILLILFRTGEYECEIDNNTNFYIEVGTLAFDSSLL